MGIGIFQLIIVLFILIMSVLPWIMSLASKRVNGSKKLTWFLLSFFFSWLGYIIYYYSVVKNIHPKTPEFVAHSDNPNRQAPY